MSEDGPGAGGRLVTSVDSLESPEHIPKCRPCTWLLQAGESPLWASVPNHTVMSCWSLESVIEGVFNHGDKGYR